MKILLHIFLIFFSIQSTYSQSFNKDSVSIVAYWEKGDKVLYELEKIRKDIRNGSITKNTQQSYIVSFEVIEQTDENYVLRYKYESVKGKDNNELEVVENMLGKLEYELLMSNTGEYLGLRNWQEIKAMTEKVTELFIDNDKISAEEKKQMRAMMAGIFGSKEQIEALASKEIAFLFQLYGYTFATDSMMSYEEILPNAFGGDPFTGKATIVFQWLDAKKVKMENTLRLDPLKTRQTISQMIKKMMENAGKSGEEAEKEMSKMDYDINDEKFLIWDIETGWVEESKFYRKTIVKQGETTAIREDIIQFKRKRE